MMTEKKLFTIQGVALLTLLFLNSIIWCAINKEYEKKRKHQKEHTSPYFCMEGKRMKELRGQSGVVGYVTLKEKCKPTDPRVEVDYD